jgi:NAD(P)-dependent dehydrogenase (short-subunit alcohol dehydrogenase family)
LPKARSTTNPLKGKIALITGATQGIGLAIARALANQQCNVTICGRNESRLSKVADELSEQKIRVLALKCDVRDEQSVTKAISAIRKKFGSIDILVNNAGIAHASRPVSQLSPRDWNDVIATNLTGMFLVTHAALPLMKRGSVIANNLSIAAKRVFPGSAAYNASKHGALGFTNTLREELRQQGIRVIALLPGATDTDIWDTLWPSAPRKKMISPESVARALVDALKLPGNTAMEQMEILPAAGTL